MSDTYEELPPELQEACDRAAHAMGVSVYEMRDAANRLIMATSAATESMRSLGISMENMCPPGLNHYMKRAFHPYHKPKPRRFCGRMRKQ